jgi:hypothetical protein
LNYWLLGKLHILAGSSRIPFSNRLNFEKKVREFVQCIFLNLLSPKMNPNTLVALMAQDTPTLLSKTRVLVWDNQLTNISHSEYLNGR